jgi:predicted O-methyltransferase YrrM
VLAKLLKACFSVFTNPRHAMREFVAVNMRLRYQDPKDWLSFKMAVDREMAARRALPSGITRVEIGEIVPDVADTPLRLLPIAMNGYNVSWQEMVYLAAITACLRPTRVIEFGTFDGRSTVQFASNLAAEGRVTTIDRVSGPVEFGVITDFCHPTTIGCHFLGKRIGSVIDLVVVDSQTADWSAYECTADLVFIDADHNRDAVIRDSRAAAAMLKPGGVIVWHDFLTLDGVTQALAVLAKEMTIHHIAGTSLAVHRSPQRAVHSRLAVSATEG